jgi:SAM-dependent methyltransferase
MKLSSKKIGMSNFKLYSQYYDLLYQDKDYESEAIYVIELIKTFCDKGKTILELGSGTGKHANLFASAGFSVLGLERSEPMVDIARKHQNSDVQFQIADITEFILDQKFDIALSLFHVISYLTDNKSLINTFKNICHHLNKNGIFIFDVWHTQAVTFQVPEKRTKTLENAAIKITRQADPTILYEQNVVEVNYDIKVEDLKTKKEINIKEIHPMRHFSKQEIELLAYATGFQILHSEEFLTSAAASNHTWGVCYILRKL